MAELFSNDPSTTLNGTINSSVTALIVTSAAGFPSSGNFRIRIDNELMLVTAVSSNTFTVTRGIEGTSAAGHTSGATVNHYLTAGALTQILADNAGATSTFGTYSALPTTYRSGDRYKCTDAPYEFINNGTWKAFLGGMPVEIPPTIFNQTTTLNGAINSSVTSLVVGASFSSMPSTPFFIYVGTEQMKVTAVSGTTWTVVRGDGGTTAASQSNGATINEMTFSLASATSNTVFTQGPGFWTLENTASATSNDYALMLKTPLAFSAPYTVIMGYSAYNNLGGNYISMGMGLWDISNPGKGIVMEGSFYNGGWNGPTSMQSWNGTGNFYGAMSGVTINFSNSTFMVTPANNAPPSDGSPMFIKLVDNNTNWLTYYSVDSGATWFLGSTVPRNTFFTPGYVGANISPRSFRCGMKVLSFKQYSGVV